MDGGAEARDCRGEFAVRGIADHGGPQSVHGVSSGLLYTWRQQLLCGALGAVADTKPRFVRVDVVAGHPQPEVTAPITPLMSPTAELDGQIEIVLSSGAKVRVDAQVNEDALRRVLAALVQQ